MPRSCPNGDLESAASSKSYRPCAGDHPIHGHVWPVNILIYGHAAFNRETISFEAAARDVEINSGEEIQPRARLLLRVKGRVPGRVHIWIGAVDFIPCMPI